MDKSETERLTILESLHELTAHINHIETKLKAHDDKLFAIEQRINKLEKG